MNESGRRSKDNICNIFTLLSVIMLIYAGFIAINEHRLNNLIIVEKMKITSIEKRDDNIYNDHLPDYKIEVQQNINGHDYTTYISRIPTGYTDKNKNNKTADYKTGDMAEVYIDSSTMTDHDFDIIYNLNLFRSGELGYRPALPLAAALICFLFGIAGITRIIDFYRKHNVFVIASLGFSLVTGIIYLMLESSVRRSSEMFKGLGEGLLFNGLLFAGMLIYIITSVRITVSDHKKFCKAGIQ